MVAPSYTRRVLRVSEFCVNLYKYIKVLLKFFRAVFMALVWSLKVSPYHHSEKVKYRERQHEKRALLGPQFK